MTAIVTILDDQEGVHSIHERSNKPQFTVNCEPDVKDDVISTLERSGVDVESIIGREDTQTGEKFIRIKGRK